jgi:WhiB family redox-sensing transcriptional regulator
MDMHWMSQGKCKEMEAALFFPGNNEGVQSAQRVCAECAVKLPCLNYALANRIRYGVWGGASERQRRRLWSSIRTLSASGAEASGFVPSVSLGTVSSGHRASA